MLNSGWQKAVQMQKNSRKKPLNVIGRRSLSREKGLELLKKRYQYEEEQSLRYSQGVMSGPQWQRKRVTGDEA